MKHLFTITFLCFAVISMAQNVSYPNNAGNGNSGDFNTSIGWESGNSLDTLSKKNTLVGFKSGENTTGSSNTFMGSFSGLSNTIGTFNTFLGTSAGVDNTIGVGNTYVGASTGEKAIGANNVFVGAYSGENTSGNLNSFFGTQSGRNNKSGGANVFIGYAAGFKNEAGGQNVFIGHSAGHENLLGPNTFIGNSSGKSNTNGTQNTFLGFESGQKSSTGGSNTFLGHRSGASNTLGTSNLFAGSGSGGGNTTGDFNVYLGTNAGISNSGGANNVYVGFNSGFYSRSSNSVFMGYLAGVKSIGEHNTFIGTVSGNANSRGHHNFFGGSNSGLGNATGNFNVFLGTQSGLKNTSGSNNLFVGYQSGYNETGSNKLYLANNAKAPLIYGDFSKSHVAIGGIPSIQDQDKYALYVYGPAYSTVVWTTSDAKFKTKKRSIINALEKINALSGMNYEYRNNYKLGREESNTALKFPEGPQLGFIAQEIQKVLPEVVRENGDGSLAVNYSGVIPVLVEAIKELSSEIETLKDQLSNEKSSLETKKELDRSVVYEGVILEQNFPNPYNSETTIIYQLPEGLPLARILIFDLQGKKVKEINSLKRGRNKIVLSASELGTGIFNYALIVGNEVITTKKMLIE